LGVYIHGVGVDVLKWCECQGSAGVMLRIVWPWRWAHCYWRWLAWAHEVWPWEGLPSLMGAAALEGKGRSGAVACADVDGGIGYVCYSAAFRVGAVEEGAAGFGTFEAWRALVAAVGWRDEAQGGSAGF